MEHELPPADIAADDWTRTPLSVQRLVRALVVVSATQQQQIDQLQAHVADLVARLNLHSQNSSKPPSSDPPSAPPRPTRTPRGRVRGAQKGHERHERAEPAPDTVDEQRHHYPDTCSHCNDDLSALRSDACAVRTQYGWELPVVRPHISAHHYHTVCCHGCGERVTA